MKLKVTCKGKRASSNYTKIKPLSNNPTTAHCAAVGGFMRRTDLPNRRRPYTFTRLLTFLVCMVAVIALALMLLTPARVTVKGAVLLPVVLHSILAADYSPDPLALQVPPLATAIIAQALRDAPHGGDAEQVYRDLASPVPTVPLDPGVTLPPTRIPPTPVPATDIPTALPGETQTPPDSGGTAPTETAANPPTATQPVRLPTRTPTATGLPSQPPSDATATGLPTRQSTPTQPPSHTLPPPTATNPPPPTATQLPPTATRPAYPPPMVTPTRPAYP